ncbi:hypothetical protein As57867_001325, partial [Aphanomyces stellatus]
DGCNLVEEVVRAIRGYHNHIHGDVKLSNVMSFVAASGGATQYKLIDFDNATRVGQPMSKHCTPEYCPPEMAQYILGHTTEPIVAATSFDVWCIAVLILKLYSEGVSLVEFADMNHEEILAEIANPGFSFRPSLTAVKLGNMQKKCIDKGLRMDPARRSTMSEFLKLLPVTVNMHQSPTTSELAGFMKEVQDIKCRLINHS